MCTRNYDCRLDIYSFGCILVDVLKCIIERTKTIERSGEKESNFLTICLIVSLCLLFTNHENNHAK